MQDAKECNKCCCKCYNKNEAGTHEELIQRLKKNGFDNYLKEINRTSKKLLNELYKK